VAEPICRDRGFPVVALVEAEADGRGEGRRRRGLGGCRRDQRGRERREDEPLHSGHAAIISSCLLENKSSLDGCRALVTISSERTRCLDLQAIHAAGTDPDHTGTTPAWRERNVRIHQWRVAVKSHWR
jgi:hypothetical protein